MNRLGKIGTTRLRAQVRPTSTPWRLRVQLPSLAFWFKSCALALALLVFAWFYSQNEKTTFLISGHSIASDRADLIELLRPYEGEGIFSLDFAELRQSLLTLIGVGDLDLERAWPNQIRIHIIPDRAIALLNQGQVITQYRHIYELADWRGAFANSAETSADQLGRLPHFQVSSGHLPEKLDWLVGLYRDLNHQLKPTDLQLSALALSHTSSLRLATTAGIALDLCRGDFSNKLARLRKAWRAYLNSVRAQIDYINLCYPNGLAWKPKAEQNLLTR